MTDAVPADLPLVFDALTEEGLRAAGSLKWTRYGDAIGAFVAEMDFGTAPEVTRALHAAIDAGMCLAQSHNQAVIRSAQNYCVEQGNTVTAADGDSVTCERNQSAK